MVAVEAPWFSVRTVFQMTDPVTSIDEPMDGM